MTMRAVCLINVDLPAIFGPVMIRRRLSVLSMVILLGINRSPDGILSRTGCLPSSISIVPLSFTFGFMYVYRFATTARVERKSAIESAAAVFERASVSR